MDRLYSTKRIRVRLGDRQYSIPANYFGATERNESDAIDATNTGFAFILFLPEFGGFTKDNWRDPFDPDRIHVQSLRQGEKDAMVRRANGKIERVTPAEYGDPKARLENFRALLEKQPSFKLYGLEGYRRAGSGDKGTRTVTWVGHRYNGEFFFFDSSYGPEDPVPSGVNPLCYAQYYSHAEGLHIAYRYSQRHIAIWREVDAGIWAKIREWRVA